MKFYKSFDRFNEQNKGMFSDQTDGNWAHRDFSIANSMTGNFFYQLFRKLTYFKRRGSLNLLASKLDDILTREYRKYLRDGMPTASEVAAAVANREETGEYDDEDEYSDADAFGGTGAAAAAAAGDDVQDADYEDVEAEKDAQKSLPDANIAKPKGLLGAPVPGSIAGVKPVPPSIGAGAESEPKPSEEWQWQDFMDSAYEDDYYVDDDADDDRYYHGPYAGEQGGESDTIDIDYVDMDDVKPQKTLGAGLLKRTPLTLPAAAPVRLLPQGGQEYSNPELDELEDELENATQAQQVVPIYNRLVKMEQQVGEELAALTARVKAKGSHADAIRLAHLKADAQRIDHLFKQILTKARKKAGKASKPKDKESDAQAVKEGLSLTDGAVRHKGWTKANTEAIMAALNMEEIEGLHIRAKLFINDNNRKRDQFRLENLWDEVLSSVYKKWYYIYDTDALKNRSSSKIATGKPGVAGAEITEAGKKAYRANAAFESIFERDTSTYMSPSFVGITAVKAQYFIFTLNANKMLLLKKCAFHKNMLFFKIIGELVPMPDKENEFYIYSDWRKNKEISKDDQTLSLLNSDNKYPLVLFFRDKVYATDIPADAKTVPGIRLDQFTMTAIKKENIFKSIITNTQNKGKSAFNGTLDTNMPFELIDKFEKLVRK